VSRDSLQEVIVCLGDPVAGNPAQFMTEPVLAEMGLDWRYLTLEVSAAQLADAIRGAKAMGFRGLNVADPHQAAALALVDDASEAAKQIGAVNCITLNDDKLIGDNTQGRGFLQLVQSHLALAGQNAVLFGAGRTAKAAAYELCKQGIATLTIVSRTPEHAEALAKWLAEVSPVKTFALPWPTSYDVPHDVRLLINATPVGCPNVTAKTPIVTTSLRKDVVIADLASLAGSTRLLREAHERRCKTIDAPALLIAQMLLSIQAWTGQTPSEEVLRDALEEYLAV
jgi:shikimate dehydrogenase